MARGRGNRPWQAPCNVVKFLLPPQPRFAINSRRCFKHYRRTFLVSRRASRHPHCWISYSVLIGSFYPTKALPTLPAVTVFEKGGDRGGRPGGTSEDQRLLARGARSAAIARQRVDPDGEPLTLRKALREERGRGGETRRFEGDAKVCLVTGLRRAS